MLNLFLVLSLLGCYAGNIYIEATTPIPTTPIPSISPSITPTVIPTSTPTTAPSILIKPAGSSPGNDDDSVMMWSLVSVFIVGAFFAGIVFLVFKSRSKSSGWEIGTVSYKRPKFGRPEVAGRPPSGLDHPDSVIEVEEVEIPQPRRSTFQLFNGDIAKRLFSLRISYLPRESTLATGDNPTNLSNTTKPNLERQSSNKGSFVSRLSFFYMKDKSSEKTPKKASKLRGALRKSTRGFSDIDSFV